MVDTLGRWGTFNYIVPKLFNYGYSVRIEVGFYMNWGLRQRNGSWLDHHSGCLVRHEDQWSHLILKDSVGR